MLTPMPAKPATGYVIQANDSVVAIVLGTETEAEAAKEQLAQADFNDDPHRYGHDYKAYRARIYWAARLVPVVKVVEAA